MYDQLIAALAKAALDADIPGAKIVLEHPAELAHGDWACNVAMMYAKQVGKSPRALGEEIAAKLREQQVPGVAQVEVAGPGFINITFKPQVFTDALAQVVQNGETWGQSTKNAGHEVVVEYTDPNPFKAFHIGHLMSNAIGESLARLIESQGTKVFRANYQGDVGIHIACAIWGIQQLGLDPHDGSRLGEAYAYGAVRYKNADKRQDWEGIKAEIDALNKIIYDKSDEKVNEIYRIGRQASLDLFEGLYALLGTKFDHYFFESELGEKGKEIVESHPDVFEDSDGAKVYKGEKVGLHTRVFLTNKGIPVYETKELALAYAKEELFPNAQTFFVVTANEITEYYKVVVAAMSEINGQLAAKMRHVAHGMMKLPEGKMSSRTGNVITGESLLNDLVAAAHTRAQESRADDVEKLARQIAVAAIKFQVLRQGTGKDIVFEQDKALSLEGDSGPYVQYAYARCMSLVRKANEQGIVPALDTAADVGDVEKMLVRFPEIVARAAEELQPHHVAHYAVDIAGRFNAWYAREQILGSNDAAHKLAIVVAAATTLKNALYLLGIAAPEKM